MTELRTIVKPMDSGDFIAVVTTLLKRINPAVAVRTEAHKRLVLVRMLFPVDRELDDFLYALKKEGVELGRWGVSEISHDDGHVK